MYIIANQLGNVLECYEETTARRPAALLYYNRNTHTNSCLHRLHKGYEIKISYRRIHPCYSTS